jgi:hypothetical protein
MALPTPPPPAFQYFADFLAKGEGAGAIALATEDALAAQEELVRAGIAAEPALALARPVPSLGEARFTLVQMPPATTPGFRCFLCQHHTREVVWRPEYQAHAIGATGIEAIIVATSNPADYGNVLDNVPVKFSKTDVSKGRRGVSSIGALRIRVADTVASAKVLKHGGFRPIQLKDGALVVPAEDAHGVMLIFS